MNRESYWKSLSAAERAEYMDAARADLGDDAMRDDIRDTAMDDAWESTPQGAAELEEIRAIQRAAADKRRNDHANEILTCCGCAVRHRRGQYGDGDDFEWHEFPNTGDAYCAPCFKAAMRAGDES